MGEKLSGYIPLKFVYTTTTYRVFWEHNIEKYVLKYLVIITQYLVEIN